MYAPMPSTIDTTAMRNITPMVTPSSVKKLLSFCTRMVERARRTASKRGMVALQDQGDAARRDAKASRLAGSRLRGSVQGLVQLLGHHLLDELVLSLVARDEPVA